MSIYTRVRAETLAAYSRGNNNFIAPASVTPKEWCRIMEDSADDFSAESVLTVIESICGPDSELLSVCPAREGDGVVCYVSGDVELVSRLYEEFSNGAAMCDFAEIVSGKLRLWWS